jgi:hypothetical protein
MGSRGPRSTNEVAMSRHTMPATENHRIDIHALARHHSMNTVQVLQAVKRLEKRGEAFGVKTKGGFTEWFWR